MFVKRRRNRRWYLGTLMANQNMFKLIMRCGTEFGLKTQFSWKGGAWM